MSILCRHRTRGPLENERPRPGAPTPAGVWRGDRAVILHRVDQHCTARGTAGLASPPEGGCPFATSRRGLFMSYELTAWAVAVERPVEAGADWTTVKLTLVTMASFADAQGRECFASVATIANRMGASPATIERAINSLKEFGLVVASEQPGRPTRFQFVDGVRDAEPRLHVTQVNDDPGHARAGSPVTEGVAHPRPRGWVTGEPQTRSLTRKLTGSALRGADRPRLTVVAEPLSTTCDRHPDGTDMPCAACGEARRQHKEFEQRRRLTALEAEREERNLAVAAERAAIRACDMCDDRGYRGSRPCDHDPDADARHARGMAQVRAVLARGSAS
ncbi:helix-turn-helix domain-containing protein [Gordonia sp. NPDC003376]